MTTFLVTRHAGALAWAQQQGLEVDHVVAHLDLLEIAAGDTVIGSLPVNLAAQVCRHGGRYLHLSIDLPLEARGLELSADEMCRYGARLEEYRVEPVK
jgi:CRISPR-associated protein Csx16